MSDAPSADRLELRAGAPLVYVSAHPEDEPVLVGLEAQLIDMAKRGLIRGWFRRTDLTGAEASAKAAGQLQHADLAILAVSASYFHSDELFLGELAIIRRRAGEGRLRVVSLIVRACAWKGDPVADDLVPLPVDEAPITKGEAWVRAVDALQREIASLGSGVVVGQEGRPALQETKDPALRPKPTADPAELAADLASLRGRVSKALTGSREVGLMVIRKLGEKVATDTGVAAGLRKVLEASRGSVRRVAERLVDAKGAVADPDLPATQLNDLVAAWLIEVPALAAAAVLADLSVQPGPEGRIAEDLLWQVLPFAIEWREQIAAVRAVSQKRGAAIVLSARTTTVAELVMAGADDRSAVFLPGSYPPLGVSCVPPPATDLVPLFNRGGEATVQAVVMNLGEEGTPQAAEWRRKLKPARTEKQRQAIVSAELTVRARRTPCYFLFIDDDVGDDPAQREELWDVVQRALGKALPDLRVARLRGGDEEFVRESHIVANVSLARDKK